MKRNFFSIFFIFFLFINLYATDNLKTTDAIVKELVNIDKNIKDDNHSKEIARIVAQKIVDENISNLKNIDRKKSLSFMVNSIKNLNYEIEILQDVNLSSEEIKGLKKQKMDLLENLPSAIINQYISYDEVLNYIEIKKQIRSNLSKYNKKSNEYTEAKIKFHNMEMGEIFYTALLKIEKIYINGGSKKDISGVIQKAILSLQTKDYSDIKSVDTNKKTYIEILNYLLENVDILQSDFFVSFLNLKDLLNYLNLKVNLQEYGINFGKTLLIVVITLFFYSLRKIMAKTLLFVFEKIFLKQRNNSPMLRMQAVNTIKEPMGILLIAYATDICVKIFYYPFLVPSIFYKIFSISYIIIYAWLFSRVLDGYGMIVFSKIARKSNRKEVVNLIIKIVYVMIFVFATLLILSSVGFNVSALIASLGIGGLAIALATKDIIANFFASVMVIFDNSFSQGDSVIIGGNIEGVIVETGLRKTAIRTPDNSLLFVPNSKIIDNTIKNQNRRTIGRLVKLTLNISYKSQFSNLEKCIKEIEKLIINHPETSTKTNSINDEEYTFLKYRKNMVSVDDLAGYKSSYYVWIDDLIDNGVVLRIEFFTISVNKNDHIKVKQDIILKILNILEKNEIKLTMK